MNFQYDFTQVEFLDPWTEIAARLDIASLKPWTKTWKWFGLQVMARDSGAWKKKALRDLRMPDPGTNVVFDWKLFVTHPFHHTIFATPRLYETYYNGNELLQGSFMACHFLTSDTALVSGDLGVDSLRTVERVKSGIWIAEAHAGRCRSCTDMQCPAVFTVFSLRHFDLYLTPGFQHLPSNQLEEGETYGADIREFNVISTDKVNPTCEQIKDLYDGLLDGWAKRFFIYPFWYHSTTHGILADCDSFDAGPGYNFRLRYPVVRDDQGEAVLIRVEHMLIHENLSSDDSNMLTGSDDDEF